MICNLSIHSSDSATQVKGLYIIYVNLIHQFRAMVQAVSRRPLNAKARVRSQVIACEVFC